MAGRAKKEKPPPGPDELVRAEAGHYRTGDGRFEIEKSDVGWYIVDTQQANEFGQHLIHGPIATLDAVRQHIPGVRDIKPLLRRPAGQAQAKSPQKTQAEQPPPPQSWIDRLTDAEAVNVRGLILALETEGLPDAEELVRDHRDDTVPTITTRVVEHRLKALVDERGEDLRALVADVVREVVDVLVTQGLSVSRPLSRWAVVVVREGDSLRQNRIRPEP